MPLFEFRKLLQSIFCDIDVRAEANVQSLEDSDLTQVLDLQPRIDFALSFRRGFRQADPSLWNCLPPHLRPIDSYSAFKSYLKTHIFP